MKIISYENNELRQWLYTTRMGMDGESRCMSDRLYETYGLSKDELYYFKLHKFELPNDGITTRQTIIEISSIFRETFKNEYFEKT